MNPNVGRLLNRHQGETIWVIGTGPSLNDLDDDELTGPRILLNRTAFSLPISPGETYWLVADDCWGLGIPGPWYQTLNELIEGKNGLTGIFRNPLMRGNQLCAPPSGENIYHFQGNKLQNVLELNRQKLALIGMLYQFAGTAATALHLAWLMGADSVNLIGCDGSDGYAERLLQWYDKPQRGGFGYLMAGESVHDVVGALKLKIGKTHERI